MTKDSAKEIRQHKEREGGGVQNFKGAVSNIAGGGGGGFIK